MTDHVVRGRIIRIAVLGVGVGFSCRPAWATDIIGVLPAALDQPRINALIRPASGGDPYIYDDESDPNANPLPKGFNIDPAYLDTGASGILLSGDATAALTNPNNGTTDIPSQTYPAVNGKTVYYEDVGVAGADRFRVSQPLNISFAAYHPNTDQKISDSQDQYNATGTFTGVDLSYYNHTISSVRATISAPLADPENDPTGPLNVMGMPAMKGKVVVFDPKPVNTLLDTMRTYIYDKGTPYNYDLRDSDPGIPRTTRTIKLSYGSFNQFTQTGTLDANNNLVQLPPDQLAANMPTLEHNPFIGPNPVNPAGDTTPPVKISFNNHTAEGSFLLDTGAAASMISTTLANQLAVRYRPGTRDTDNPVLETYNPSNPSAAGTQIADQFQLDIGGVGGTTRVAGFYLNSLLVRTMEGNAANDNDPKHFRFLDAPVLVNDVSLKDPNSSTALTLDGIFGVNFLVASALIEYTDLGGGVVVPFPTMLSQGAFDWAVFDESAGQLKLRPRLNGDANRDGVVNFVDLLALARNFNKQPSTDDPYNSGDFNGDGIVNFDDLLVLAKHYNLTDLLDTDSVDNPPFPFDIFGASTVPEPTTAGLLVGAVIAPLLGRGSRRRRRH